MKRHTILGLALLVFKLIGFGIATVGLVVGVAISAWYLGGGQLLTVQTGSMRPEIRPGDVVAVTRVALNNLRAGDIVSYRSTVNPQLIVTHRLINQKGYTLLTKGDSLEEADSPIVAQQIVGRVVYKVSYLGRVTKLLKHPLLAVIGLYCFLVTCVVAEARRFRRCTVYRCYHLEVN